MFSGFHRKIGRRRTRLRAHCNGRTPQTTPISNDIRFAPSSTKSRRRPSDGPRPGASRPGARLELRSAGRWRTRARGRCGEGCEGRARRRGIEGEPLVVERRHDLEIDDRGDGSSAIRARSQGARLASPSRRSARPARVTSSKSPRIASTAPSWVSKAVSASAVAPGSPPSARRSRAISTRARVREAGGARG